jgi:protoporphyrin/coproporphyrin ferrochelatase
MSNHAVLLVNLGSPDSPSVPDVRRYLREFLMDGRVIDAPWPVRFAIVHGSILPKRPRESAHAYSTIWTREGSPLIATSRRVQALLQQELDCPVELAMRYQNPSIDDAIERLSARGIEHVRVIPLFPHYAMSSYETAVERVRDAARKFSPEIQLSVHPPFYAHPAYIDALVATAEPYLRLPHDHLLFSFHGLPERHLRKADKSGCHCLKAPNCCETPSPVHATCYRAQCFATVREFLKASDVKPAAHSVAFQSRLGRDPWMKPYTDEELARLARSGVKRLLVMCPAFVTDCLETIEEIGARGRETFLAHGGEELTLVPCLNEHPSWIAALKQFVSEESRPAAVAEECIA